MRLRVLLTASALMALPAQAAAFDDCDRLAQNPGTFQQEARREAIGRAPVKYAELAKNIRLVVQTPESVLIPIAGEQQGVRFVAVPVPFARLACQMAHATYLKLDGVQPEAFAQAARTAAACVDEGRPRRGCLIAFGDDLARRYRNAFAKLPDRARTVVNGISQAALWQTTQHEYAHHYLNHNARVNAKQMSRLDAEFEADYFAIANGIQAGDPSIAMYYVFEGLAEIEAGTTQMTTPDYESGACRANNIENISNHVGIAPLLVMDAAGGGGVLLQTNSPQVLHQYVEEHFGGPAPALNARSCGNIVKASLGDAYAELKKLALRVDADADMLFSQQAELDTARATRLVRDLTTMTGEFRQADGIAAKTIALMLQGWGLKGRGGTPLAGEVDRLFDNQRVVGNLQSEDYGRIRAAQGLVLLQERSDVPRTARLDGSARLLQDAVAHNPKLSEAWMNLAFISFMRDDCAAAARYADQSLATFTGDEESQEGNEFFARSMKEWSLNPAMCREKGATFTPYDGL